MITGNKSNQKKIALNWQQVFAKNAANYLQKIIIELSALKDDKIDTGSELLTRIKIEKEKLRNDKQIKKEICLPPIKIEEIQFEIPNNWVWCRLGEMSINCDGARIPVSQLERDKKDKTYDYYGASGIIDKIDGYTHDGKYLLIGEDGANLIAKSTPIAFLAMGKFWVNNHAHVLTFLDEITFNYMEYCLNTININSYITGGFQPKLSQSSLNIIPIPLPPLSEQKGIVDFLTDFERNNLNANGSYFNRQVEQKIITLHKSQLKGSEISIETIYQLALLKKLRLQILQDAIMGKLVPTNPNDEPASKLLERIKAKKEQLKTQKKIKKEKPLPEIKPEEIPFEIPENWRWCRLGAISELMGRIGWKGLTASEYKKSGPLFLSVYSLNYGDYVNYLQAFHISQERYDESPEIMLQNNDILICKDGAGIGKLGIVKELKEQATVNSSLLVIRCNSMLNFKYIYFFLNSKHFQNIVNSKIMGATTPHLYQRDLVNFNVALPPVEEQNRIVTKIENLITLCDELEQTVQQNQKHNQKLLQVALKEALELKLVR
jgi:type I restriction enzyme S subunit